MSYTVPVVTVPPSHRPTGAPQPSQNEGQPPISDVIRYIEETLPKNILEREYPWALPEPGTLPVNHAPAPSHLFPDNSVLNRVVSCYSSYRDNDSTVTVHLMEWLTNSCYLPLIEEIRATNDKTRRSELKSQLPAITPSGLFYQRNQNALIRHSGLIQFDIDMAGDNLKVGNMAELGEQLQRIEHVAYCGLSASGNGWWGLIPIAYPKLHKDHFKALRRDFAAMGIEIDDKPQNIASMRGYSVDANGYFNHQAKPYTKVYSEPPPKRVLKRKAHNNDKEGRFLDCLEQLQRGAIDITGDYGDWLGVARAFANEYGESGRDYFHQVSQFYPKYSSSQTDQQYTAALRSPGKATLGTFFYLCDQHGVSYSKQ